MTPWMLGVAVGSGLVAGLLILGVVLLLTREPEPPPVVVKPVEPRKIPVTPPVDPGVKPMPKPVDPNPLPMVVIPPLVPMPMPAPMPMPPVDPGPLPMVGVPAALTGQDSGQIPGLVFYTPLDEGAGTEANDGVKKLRGIFKGTSAPQWVDGKYGKALAFDGRCHVEFGRNCEFEADQPFSFGGWLWIEQAAADGTVAGRMNPGNKKQKGYELFVNDQILSVNLNTTGTTEISVEQPNIPRGQWVHVMATYAGTRSCQDSTLYVSGRAIGKRVGMNLPGSLDVNSQFCIGGRAGTYGFQGKIDEFRVYDRALTSEEVAYIATHDPADLRAPASRRVALTLDADGAPSDLLPLVDAAQDSLAGQWTPGEKSSLAAPADGLFQIPVSPPLRYRLTLIGTRTAETGELTIGLPLGIQTVAATFFAPGAPVSVADLDGKPLVTTSDKITSLGEFAIICDCSPEGIKIRVNGEDAISWEGTPDRVALPAKWKPRNPRQPFLATTGGSFQIARVQLARPAAGSAEQLASLPPPPTDEELKQALADVKAEFQKAIRTARTPEARIAVAEEFLTKGKSTTDAKLQFAHLVQARDAAAQAGGAELAIDAVNYLSDKYRLDGWDQRAKILTEAARVPQLAPGRQMQLARLAGDLAIAAARADQYAAADKLLDVSETTAVKFKDNDTRAAIKQQREELALLAKVSEEGAKARQTLLRDPTDAAAHLALGRYYCFAQNEWVRGAKELRQAGDAKLTALAAAELAAVDADTRKAAGEAWWRQAQVGNDPCKTIMERHGLELLADALPGLSPPVQKESLRFISQMFVQTPAATPRPTRRGLKAWFKADEGVQSQGGVVHTWNDASGNGNSARQDKPQFAMRLAPNVLGGKPVLRSEEGTGQCLTFKLNDIGSYEGLTVLVVANTGSVDRNECFLGVPGPDVILFFGAYGNSVGYIGGNNDLFGIGKKRISADEPFLVTYRCKRKEGWQVDFKGVDAGYVADKQFPIVPHSFNIGSYQPNVTNQSPFGGDIAEILIYDHSLGAADYRQACLYLNLKYQLCFPVPPGK